MFPQEYAVYSPRIRIWPLKARPGKPDAVHVDLHDVNSIFFVRRVHVQVPDPTPILIVLRYLITALGSGHHGRGVVDSGLHPGGGLADVIQFGADFFIGILHLRRIILPDGRTECQPVPVWLLQIQGHLLHREGPVHPIGPGRCMDRISQGERFIIAVQIRQIQSGELQHQALILVIFEPLLPLLFQVRRDRHIIPGDHLLYPAVTLYSFRDV